MSMDSSFGLPRYVVTFLRHMESHKDYLKWNICESSHKITLTLTWNFRLSKNPSMPDNFLDKLQRTLNIGRSPNNDINQASVPADLTKFLETTPKSHRKTDLKHRLSLTVGAIRRTLSTGSSHPSRNDSINRSSSFNALSHSQLSNHSGRLTRHNSFHTYSGYKTPDRHTSVYSPTRSAYSLVEGTFSRQSSIHNSQSADDLDFSAYSTPHTDGFNVSSVGSSDSSRSPRKPRRLRLTYRSEDELEESLENIMQKTRYETQSKLEEIRQEWNETLREWPKIITAETLGGRYCKPPPSLASTFIGASAASQSGNDDILNDGDISQISGEESTSMLNSPDSPDTIKSLAVFKCLDSCDKILTRYETEI